MAGRVGEKGRKEMKTKIFRERCQPRLSHNHFPKESYDYMDRAKKWLKNNPRITVISVNQESIYHPTQITLTGIILDWIEIATTITYKEKE
ncbi:MAG: hypothetical protein GF349_00960 [Candidatus Magasanikbacteria bacterium]|nr:hypothetical protein [Candidatus Magasanikbacteria bacterium]